MKDDLGDFGDVIFEDLPINNAPKFIQCHHKQREALQRQMEKAGVKYAGLLKMCSKMTGRTIVDVGRLSRSECDRMIELLGGRAREIDYDDQN